MATKQNDFSGKYTRLDFSQNDKTKISKWVEAHPNSLDEAIVKLTDGMCKVSFSYSDYYDCYYISLTVKDQHHALYDHTFSVNHTSLRKGMGVIMYVFSELLPNQSPLLDGKDRDLDW
jgi:hypothetical protein